MHLIPSVLLERAASHFRVARGLEVRRYTSVHLRLFDALSRPRFLQKHWVLPAAHAAAHVCRVLRANARDSSKSSSWLEDAVNSLERLLGIDMDGDGDIDFYQPRPPAVYYLKNLLPSFLLTVVLQLLSAAIFCAIDPTWDFGSAVYHCIVTVSARG